MRVFLIFSISALLSGCASTMPAPPQTSKISVSREELSAIETGLRESLKDPGSMVLGSVAAASSGDGIVYVCGTVNAKNSFGGYVGYQPFLGIMASMKAEGKTIAHFSVSSIGGSETDASIVISLCKHYGVF